jgi:anti-sigma regulatory factor (Ser/Thr protein kinase)
MTPACEQAVQLTIRSTPAHLTIVRAALEKMCEAVGFDSEATGRTVLAVDEALANIIRHAYKGEGGKPIEIELSPLPAAGGAGLRVRIRDYGQHVDPSRMRSRELGDVRPGGLGVHIMTHCMDAVEYAPAEGGGTILTMTKRLRATAEAAKEGT